MSSLGIKEIRKALDITAEQLGKEVGLSASYILRIESGNVQNPSFTTVAKLAEVIANTESVKNGNVDLNQFDSHFSRLVLSFRHKEIKEVYDFVKDNKDIDVYVEMVKYLLPSDMNTISSLIEYRKLSNELDSAKQRLKDTIIKYSDTDSYEETVKIISFRNLFNNAIDIDYEMEELLLGNNKFDGKLLSRILLSMADVIELRGIECIYKSDDEINKFNTSVDEDDDKEQEIIEVLNSDEL